MLWISYASIAIIIISCCAITASIVYSIGHYFGVKHADFLQSEDVKAWLVSMRCATEDIEKALDLLNDEVERKP